MEMRKCYPSAQMLASLEPQTYKLLSYICMWQSQERIKYLPSYFSKVLNMSVEEIELNLQTLIDASFIELTTDDYENYFITLNEIEFGLYFRIKMDDIIKKGMFPIAKEVKFKKTKEQSKTAPIQDSLMTEAETRQLYFLLNEVLKQRRLKAEKFKDTVQEDCDPLPF